MRGKRRKAARNLAAAFVFSGVLFGFNVTATAQSLAVDSDLVASRVTQLLETVAPGASAEAAIPALEALATDDQLSLSTREWILHDFAMLLREEDESAAGRRALQWLAGYRSQVKVQHEERGPATITKWRVAGVARGTLALWNRAVAAAGLQRQLDAGTMDLSAARSRAESAQNATLLAQTLREASPEQLRAQRDQLLKMLKQDATMAPAAAEAALRLQDAELSQAVFTSGDRRTAARLIADIGRTMPAERAFPILQKASAEAALASAAIVEIGRSAADLPAARGFLLEALADPEQGGSAATALAAMKDDEMVQAVTAELEASDDENLQSKAVLMLVLDGSPLARESLRDFALRPDVSAELREEVLTWLREGTEQ